MMTIHQQKISVLKDYADYLSQESDWRKIRLFFAELESYSPELTSDELEYFLTVCYDLLLHPKKAVRRMSARAAGALIAGLGPVLAQVWEDFLRKILFPVEQEDEQINYWLSYCLMQITETAVSRLSEADRKVFLRIYGSYFRSTRWSRSACLTLISGISPVSYQYWTPLQQHEIFGFVRQFISDDWGSVITTSLLLLKSWKDQGWRPQENELRYMKHLDLPAQATYAQRYLLTCLTEDGENSIDPALRRSDSYLMQEDMHPDNDWASKLVHLDILKSRLKNMTNDASLLASRRFQYANHLQDLLRMSPHPIIYMKAGTDLLTIMPYLDPQQNFDICYNILKEIEMGVDSANSVSFFLGHGFFFLNDAEQEEFSAQFAALLDSSDETNAMTALETVAIICACQNTAAKKMSDSVYRRLLGFLSAGQCTYREKIAYETRYLVGQYQLEKAVNRFGPVEISSPVPKGSEPIAFFPGSFDPFTTRDKAIVMELLEQNFIVCLSISDFDWEKNAQPERLRRKMIHMALADLQNVHLLAEGLSVYLHNENDLEKLKKLYPGREIWLVEESTQLESSGEAALNFPHIIYSSNERHGYLDQQALAQFVQNQVISLILPAFYQNMKSEDVQSLLLSGKSISGLVDHQVQRMITDRKLYLDKPFFRKNVPTQKIHTRMETTDKGSGNAASQLIAVEYLNNNHWYSGSVKWHAAGVTLVIDEISGDQSSLYDSRDLALMEFLAYAQANGFQHIVCFEAARYQTLLMPYGFRPMKDFEEWATLDLTEVTILFLDIESAVNSPYAQDPRIQKVIRENHRRLREVVTNLYPGKLTLAFPSAILNEKIIHKIVKEENSDHAALSSAAESSTVCVPFGKMMTGAQIPGIITHELNTEKKYTADLSSFEIREFPEYSSLHAQIEKLKSFGKSIILIDDLFHKGFRFEKIADLIHNSDIQLEKMAVSVLSTRGEQLAEKQQVEVEAVYKVPNLKIWLLESDLYPFVGGDGIENPVDESARIAALCSINTILPYEYPPFLKDVPIKNVYQFSRICLENAIRLYQALEEVYSETNHRILTMERMQEVMAQPRYPIGIQLEGCRKKKISQLLSEELKTLERMRV